MMEKIRPIEQKESGTQKLLNYFKGTTVAHSFFDAFRSEEMSPTDSSVPPSPFRALVIPAKVAYLPNLSKETTEDIGRMFEYYQGIGIGPKEIRFVEMPEGTTSLAAALKDIEKHHPEETKTLKLSLFSQSPKTEEVLTRFFKEKPLDTGSYTTQYCPSARRGFHSRSSGNVRFPVVC
jgi:hypothetical protein